MEAGGAIPTGDEPVDLFDRRLGAGTGPLGGGPPGSAPRGTTIVGGQSGPRRRGERMAIQSLRRQPEDTTPPREWSARGSSQLPKEEGARSRNPRRSPCPHLERSSTPLEPRGLGLGRSSAFFRYRNHSSFVDGRDARLARVRLPSGRGEHSSRHPPLRTRRLTLRGCSKGACSEDPPRGESAGLVQNQILSPQHRPDSRKTVGLDVWTVMHMEQEGFAALNKQWASSLDRRWQRGTPGEGPPGEGGETTCARTPESSCSSPSRWARGVVAARAHAIRVRDVTRRCGTEITGANYPGALLSQAARTVEARGGRRRCNVRSSKRAGFSSRQGSLGGDVEDPAVDHG